MAVIKIFKQRTTSLGIDRVKTWSLVRIDSVLVREDLTECSSSF